MKIKEPPVMVLILAEVELVRYVLLAPCIASFRLRCGCDERKFVKCICQVERIVVY